MSFLNVKLPDTIAPAGLFVGGKIERMSSRKVLSDYLCKIDGLEVTELGDGGYYFAPPGDFSKVDFSACHELGESVNFDAEHNELPRREPVTIRVTYGDKICPEAAIQAADAVRARVIGRVGKTARYVIGNEYSSPKTAQHSKQAKPIGYRFKDWQPYDGRGLTAQVGQQTGAKPALPSLMTEAGERYRGLGWCDE